jgi:NADH:ubiquinone oxidoreductase subunit 3 (subunit A)
MSTLEFALLALACFQPLIIGTIAFYGVGRVMDLGGVDQRLSSIRSRISGFRFYECATYSRLTGMLAYGSQVFSILIAYLIYDVDLLFFFAEAMFLADYGVTEFCVLSTFMALFVLGVSFDKRSTQFA